MLTITAQQMSRLEQAALLAFEDEMVAHGQDFSPRLAAVLGPEQLRRAVRAAIARAARHGFVLRGPTRLMVEMMFLFGSAFDNDPQYPWVTAILAEQADPMQRAQRLYEEILRYQSNVSGENAVNTRQALVRMRQISHQLPDLPAARFLEGTIWELRTLFPEKAAYLGEAALKALVYEAAAAGKQAGFSIPRSITVLVALMFAFGHGCTDDPLYPWIGQTLNDPRIKDAAARAERLERKALTWLDHVLAANARESQA